MSIVKYHESHYVTVLDMYGVRTCQTQGWHKTNQKSQETITQYELTKRNITGSYSDVNAEKAIMVIVVIVIIATTKLIKSMNYDSWL